MTDDFPRLTLFLGPYSSHGLALNMTAKTCRAAFGQAGLRAYPTRRASPALRDIASVARTLEERQLSFAELSAAGPAFYSAVGFLGSAHHGGRGAEAYEDAAAQLGSLAEVAGDQPFRIVLALDPLPDLFLAAESDLLDGRIRETPWEMLYDFSWANMVEELMIALPHVSLTVLTHAGTALGGGALAAHLFGPAAAACDPKLLLRATLTTTGQAVMDRMGEAGPDEAGMRELYQSFADRASNEVCKERLGIDRLTRKILLQRYDEDLMQIAALPRVEVF